jgi:hypothetical protein
VNITGPDHMPLELAEWEAFYVITGSAGAVLTGLLFVVVALAAERIPRQPRPGPSPEMNAFATPNIVHFCIVLLVAALMMIPGETGLTLSLGLASCGLFGLIYSIVSIARMRRLRNYVPVLDDWIWHGTLPFIAYAALIIGAVVLGAKSHAALYVVAGSILVLLVIGLHNAWDIALFTATYQAGTSAEPGSPAVDAAEEVHRAPMT